MPLQIDLMTDRENKLVRWYEYLEDIGDEQYFLLRWAVTMGKKFIREWYKLLNKSAACIFLDQSSSTNLKVHRHINVKRIVMTNVFYGQWCPYHECVLTNVAFVSNGFVCNVFVTNDVMTNCMAPHKKIPNRRSPKIRSLKLKFGITSCLHNGSLILIRKVDELSRAWLFLRVSFLAEP